MLIYVVGETTTSNKDGHNCEISKEPDTDIGDDDLDSNYIEEEKQVEKEDIGLDTGEETKEICKSKKVKKTKLERSIELLSESFTNASKREVDMMTQLEEKRHKHAHGSNDVQ